MDNLEETQQVGEVLERVEVLPVRECHASSSSIEYWT